MGNGLQFCLTLSPSIPGTDGSMGKIYFGTDCPTEWYANHLSLMRTKLLVLQFLFLTLQNGGTCGWIHLSYLMIIQLSDIQWLHSRPSQLADRNMLRTQYTYNSYLICEQWRPGYIISSIVTHADKPMGRDLWPTHLNCTTQILCCFYVCK